MKRAVDRRYSVFLSHSSRDNWLAGIVARILRKAGVEVWIDEMSLSGGDTVIPTIMDGMNKSHEAIVLVSNESIKSQWVAAEIGMAMALKKRLTPLLNNVDCDAMAPLKGVKSYELNQIDSFLRELKKRKQRAGQGTIKS
jgi:TIR domain